jgi:type II secretory pathway component GspD/PulD (secretin)
VGRLPAIKRMILRLDIKAGKDAEEIDVIDVPRSASNASELADALAMLYREHTPAIEVTADTDANVVIFKGSRAARNELRKVMASFDSVILCGGVGIVRLKSLDPVDVAEALRETVVGPHSYIKGDAATKMVIFTSTSKAKMDQVQKLIETLDQAAEKVER